MTFACPAAGGQLGQLGGVRAVGDQDAELAPGEAVRAVGQDAQRRGGGQVRDRLAGGRQGVGQLGQAEAAGDRPGQVLVYVAERGHHPAADRRLAALAELEGERVDDVLLLDVGLADEELACLAVVVGEAFRPQPPLGPGLVALAVGVGAEAGRRVLPRAGRIPGVRLVIDPALRVGHGHVTVLLEVRERALGRVDRQVGEVRAAQPLELGVEVGEVPALQQRIVGEVDTRHDVLGTERHLLGLGEEVVHHPVQDQPPDPADRDLLLGNDLGRVQDVEREPVGELVVEQLQPELPLGKVSLVDGIPQVAAVEVGVGTVDLDRLVPHHRLQPGLGLPVELDERRPAFGVDQPERVHAEPLHEPERPRDGPVGHDPHQHVGRLGHQRREVPEVVVRRLGLREAAVRLLLGRVDEVRELDRVLDEEHRDVVPDQVPVALPGVELGGEAAHVPGQVRGALVARHRGEPDEHRRAQPGLGERVGPGDVGQRLVVLEVPVRPVAAGMDHPLGDPLVIEVEDLLPEVEVLQRAGTAFPGPQRVLVVGDDSALPGGQPRRAVRRDLVRLAARAALDPLIAVLHRLAVVLVVAGSHRSSWVPLGTGRRRSGSGPVRCPLYPPPPG